jgi:uncharacterized iron-regulated protein
MLTIFVWYWKLKNIALNITKSSIYSVKNMNVRAAGFASSTSIEIVKR